MAIDLIGLQALQDEKTLGKLEIDTHTEASITQLATATEGLKTDLEIKKDEMVEELSIAGVDYVVKEEGKKLSSNDYTNLEKTKLGDLYTKTNLDLELNKKQNVTDELLETDSKNVIGGINEVNTKVINQGEQIQNLIKVKEFETGDNVSSMSVDFETRAIIVGISVRHTGNLKYYGDYHYVTDEDRMYTDNGTGDDNTTVTFLAGGFKSDYVNSVGKFYYIEIL